jgi:hypothetical protein
MIRTFVRLLVLGAFGATVVLGVVLAPSVARADTVRLVDRRVETVTGAEIAIDTLTHLAAVDVGSSGATVTVQAADGVRKVPFRVDLAADGGGVSFGALALMIAAGSLVTRIAALLSRLFG